MSEYFGTLKLRLLNFENEAEAKEAMHHILNNGLVNYNKNIGDIAAKPVSIEDIEYELLMPSFRDMDSARMAKAITGYFSISDRQEGIYESRGAKIGAFYVISEIVQPMLKRFNVDHLFDCYVRAGTDQVLIQDILDNVVVNFEAVPSKLFDIAAFCMKLVDYYRQHETEYLPYLLTVSLPAGNVETGTAAILENVSEVDMNAAIEEIESYQTAEVESQLQEV